MKSYYDNIADGYEELYKEEQLKKLNLINDNMVVYRSDLMLDVGCGPGFASEVFDCRIMGLDPSEELLKQCSFKTVRCEAEEMPFPDNYFDVVIAVTSIHNFDDFKKGLLEMKRVGKERFAFTLLRKSSKFTEMESFIRNNFTIRRKIVEEKDLIFICG